MGRSAVEISLLTGMVEMGFIKKGGWGYVEEIENEVYGDTGDVPDVKTLLGNLRKKGLVEKRGERYRVSRKGEVELSERVS